LKSARKTASHKALNKVMRKPRITQGFARKPCKTAPVKGFRNVYDFCQVFAVFFLKKVFLSQAPCVNLTPKAG